MSITYEYSSLVTTLSFVLLALMSVRYSFQPQKAVFSYLFFLFIFTGSLYGAEGANLTFYTRGTGLMPLSIINIYLLFLFVYAGIATRVIGPYKSIPAPKLVTVPLVLLTILFILYAGFGVLKGVAIENVLSRRGLITLLNMTILYYTLKWVIDCDVNLDLFVKLLVSVAIAMAIYGLIRFLLFGGDPANYYANFEGSRSRLTFFDYGQSVLFLVTTICLYLGSAYKKGFKKIVAYSGSGILFVNILFSFRRTALLGLMFVVIWLFCISSLRKKMAIAILSLLLIAVSINILQTRFQNDKKKQSMTSDLVANDGSFDVKKNRFGEIYHAVAKTNEINPFFGAGPWGVNCPRITPWKETDFVHSSLGHMYVKMGLVGLLVYVWLLVSYVLWWVFARRKKWKNERMKIIGDAFFCGFLFEIPDLLFGTPFIIYRHTQILAILLVLPGICQYLGNKLDASVSAR
ncbi:hypothetical protein DSCA_23290 [Desulfosarcina alkanivorans]|uniref:O-antigen ligase-related domain-containing protein n=1 Tax=Desulfosarcina alkanivorans TaxID=571177 RepID=A0A5K7YKJ3_9BACT|nr:O-antigen ligase family protein [Desulfosarcina alkanivorans]BBO68399.1 hypothetical protein DSCA_23290 [Desulfosarcina alkanivorans]